MQTDPIAELQTRIEALWARTDLGRGRPVTVQTSRQDDGSPHVEIVASRYDIVTTERGRETDRTAGLTLEEAAGWFVFRMAEGHAQKMELMNRRAPKDAPPSPNGPKDDGYSRWNWMAPTISTMHRISTDLGDWTSEYYSTVLRQAPLKEYERRNARWPLQLKTG